MISIPNISFSKSKTDGLKESEFDKRGNISRTTSKKAKGNFSTNSVSKEKIQALFKSDNSIKYSLQTLQTDKSKRQLNSKAKERDQNKSSLSDYFVKINKIYDDYKKRHKNWIRLFLELINKEKLVDVSNITPSMREFTAEPVFLNSKFWVLFIEFKKSTISPSLSLEKLIEMFDESLKYELNDISLIHEAYLSLVSKYNKEAIYYLLRKKNYDKLPNSSKEITSEDYRFLLKFPDHFFFKNPNDKFNLTNSKRSKILKSINEEKIPIRSNDYNNSLEGKNGSSEVLIKEIKSNESLNVIDSEQEKIVINSIIKDDKILSYEKSSIEDCINNSEEENGYIHINIENFSLNVHNWEIKEEFVICNSAEISFSRNHNQRRNFELSERHFFEIKNSFKSKFHNDLTIINESQFNLNEGLKEKNKRNKSKQKRNKSKIKEEKSQDSSDIEEIETKEEINENKTKISKAKGKKPKIIEEIEEKTEDKTDDEIVNKSLHINISKNKVKKRRTKNN